MVLMGSVGVSSESSPHVASFKESPDFLAATRDVLVQGLSLLFELDDRKYSKLCSGSFQVSIGQHYRHVLEHFECFLFGMHSGEIDYDQRERNRRTETEVTYACIATCDVLRALKRESGANWYRNCSVRVSVGYETMQPSVVESNLAQELDYCARHALEHYTIIKMLCASEGIKVPAGFGILPSTVTKSAPSSQPSVESAAVLA